MEGVPRTGSVLAVSVGLRPRVPPLGTQGSAPMAASPNVEGSGLPSAHELTGHGHCPSPALCQGLCWALWGREHRDL